MIAAVNISSTDGHNRHDSYKEYFLMYKKICLKCTLTYNTKCSKQLTACCVCLSSYYWRCMMGIYNYPTVHQHDMYADVSIGAGVVVWWSCKLHSPWSRCSCMVVVQASLPLPHRCTMGVCLGRRALEGATPLSQEPPSLNEHISILKSYPHFPLFLSIYLQTTGTTRCT